LVLGQIPLEAKRGGLFSYEKKTRGWTLRNIYVEVRMLFEYQINVFDSSGREYSEENTKLLCNMQCKETIWKEIMWLPVNFQLPYVKKNCLPI